MDQNPNTKPGANGAAPKKASRLGCLFNPAVMLIVGVALLLFSGAIRIMDRDYFDNWAETSIVARKWSSRIVTHECDYLNCSNNSAWEIDFTPWPDLDMPYNPNFPSTESHTRTSTETQVRREKNTYLVPDGDKIKVETKTEWNEYKTPVKKSYDTFDAHYCDDHIDAAQKLIWDTAFWEHYKYTYIAMGAGGVLTVAGIIWILIMRVMKKKGTAKQAG